MAKFQLKVENKIDPRTKLYEGFKESPPDVTIAKNQVIAGQRQAKYGHLQNQLDMLWHDIDEGRIQADTTSANTWYQHIKKIKEDTPFATANTSL